MPSLNENDCLIVILARHSVSCDILCIYINVQHINCFYVSGTLIILHIKVSNGDNGDTLQAHYMHNSHSAVPKLLIIL